jgi:methenyltetrahydrofolate cyclohydrolase
MITVRPLASSDWLEEPLPRFVERLGEETPAPGAGSTAAVVTALGAALVEMAARFSSDWADGGDVVEQARALRERALRLAVRDAEDYEKVLRAFRLPRQPDHARREVAVRRALEDATAMPLAIAASAAQVAELGKLVVDSGNANLRGEAAGGAALGAAAARISANLVSINLAASANDKRIEQGAGLAAAAAESAGRAFAALGEARDA